MITAAVLPQRGTCSPARRSAFHIRLVGSVPLPNAEQVLRTLGRQLGDRLRRIPDG